MRSLLWTMDSACAVVGTRHGVEAAAPIFMLENMPLIPAYIGLNSLHGCAEREQAYHGEGSDH
jgi:hypothetical protein